jgi:hypothetical protein
VKGKRQRHLWAARGNCSVYGAGDLIEFFPKRPKRDEFGGSVAFIGEAVTSECVKALERFTGFTVEPGKCVKVNVSISPADGSHPDIPTTEERKRTA